MGGGGNLFQFLVRSQYRGTRVSNSSNALVFGSAMHRAESGTQVNVSVEGLTGAAAKAQLPSAHLVDDIGVLRGAV